MVMYEQKKDSASQFDLDADLMKGATALSFLGPGLLKILDSFPFYVLLIDSRHHILLANKATRDDLGLEPEEIVGEHCPRVVHGLEAGSYPGCPLEEAIETGQGVEREYFDEKTGRWLKISLYPTGAWSVDGQEIYLHMMQDITGQKEAIEKLRKCEEKSK